MDKKKMVICASASFEPEIIHWKNLLEKDYDVIKYPTKIEEDLINNYKKEFSEHYEAISKADILLVLNFEKKGVKGYIGSGVFAEMAFALGLNKSLNKKIEVRFLNPIPQEGLPYSDELNLWKELGWIKSFT